MGRTPGLELGPSNSPSMTPSTQVNVMLKLKDLLHILVFIFRANSNHFFVSQARATSELLDWGHMLLDDFFNLDLDENFSMVPAFEP